MNIENIVHRYLYDKLNYSSIFISPRDPFEDICTDDVNNRLFSLLYTTDRFYVQ